VRFPGATCSKNGAELQRVSKYERGVIWPTMELMVAFAKAFDVTVDYLIRNDKHAAVGKIKNFTNQ
jgi:transcriptional regulator with XRE-family HTH domain